jgi:hypothetical protein
LVQPNPFCTWYSPPDPIAPSSVTLYCKSPRS